MKPVPVDPPALGLPVRVSARSEVDEVVFLPTILFVLDLVEDEVRSAAHLEVRR